ncbi:unnamed protein product [Polarella glacialis]|uniref:Radical SAM core domain-containing protein n=2 Tax=Polarella glacialis TaxID=89957 RepID=A0A813FCB3_POLGL|nr:unnamed protein product [Polarella glacialis]
MAGAQTSEVDGVLKGFLTDFPTVIGFVVLNADGIPVKWHEQMPYERAVIYAALLSDFVNHCKKCLRELLSGPAESELANVRIRTKEGTEVICVTYTEYTLIVIQNCTGKVAMAQTHGERPTRQELTASRRGNQYVLQFLSSLRLLCLNSVSTCFTWLPSASCQLTSTPGDFTRTSKVFLTARPLTAPALVILPPGPQAQRRALVSHQVRPPCGVTSSGTQSSTLDTRLDLDWSTTVRYSLLGECPESPALLEAAAWELALEVGPRSSEASSLRGKGLGLVSRVVRADGGAAAGGAKLLLELSGGQRVETAIIMAADRRRKGGPAATICISSQAGCAMACRFCDTGLMGRPAEATATTAFKEAAAAVANGTPGSSKRNLDVAGGASGGKLNLPTWAILEQVLHAEAWVQREMGRDQGLDAASNIVFMGMGEPLLNYNSVLSASRALCQGSARRKVTLSTVGVTPRIESLTRDFPSGLRLALSLHAPTQELREQLLPVAARAWPLQALMQSVRNFEASTGSGVLIEYILLRGVNDEETHADALADLIAREGLQCAGVNLIPYNPTTAGSSAGYEVPSDARCKAFRARLRSLGTPNVTIRFSTKCGRDSASACGQLGLRSVS